MLSNSPPGGEGQAGVTVEQPQSLHRHKRVPTHHSLAGDNLRSIFSPYDHSVGETIYTPESSWQCRLDSLGMKPRLRP